MRTLLSRVPQHADVAVILNPRVTPVEFLLTICEELGLGLDEADRSSVKEMVDALNRRLLAAHAEGRRVIVIVDEAQNLSAEVLEQVRLLTNLETATQKLLQIILIGQPELREILDRTELRQLAQRITGRYHSESARRKTETQEYVRHRLRVAGASGEIFTPAALREVHRVSSGVPARHQCVSATERCSAPTPEETQEGDAGAGAPRGGRSLRPALCAAVARLGRGSERARRRLRHRSCSASRSGSNPPLHRAPAKPVTGRSPGAGGGQRAEHRRWRRGRSDDASRGAACGGAAVSINALLAANAANTSDAAAFRRLLSLWGTAMADDQDPCGQAQKAGLACLDQRGSWAQVRALNRPAILTLTDDRGPETPRRAVRARRLLRHARSGRAQRARSAR